VDYSGPEVEIGFNAQYMLDFLRGAGQTKWNSISKIQTALGELRPHGGVAGHCLPLCCDADAHLISHPLFQCVKKKYRAERHTGMDISLRSSPLTLRPEVVNCGSKRKLRFE